jgi:hypothetical protein
MSCRFGRNDEPSSRSDSNFHWMPLTPVGDLERCVPSATEAS